MQNLLNGIISTFLGLSLMCAPAWAQPSAADSLKKRMLMDLPDTSMIMVFYAYGELFETAAPDTALFYFNRARDLSIKAGFTRGQAAFASRAIVVLNNQGKFREALEYTQEALRLYEQEGSKYDLATAYLNIGSEWQYLSDFQSAAGYYVTALKLGEEIGDKRIQRIANNNLASIFINLQEYQKGIDYAERSLAVARELKNEYAISSSLFNIATAEIYLKEYDRALERYKQIEAIGLRTGDYIVMLDGWLGQADAYSAAGKHPEAERYYRKVIPFAQEKQAPEYEMYAYMGITDVYMKSNRLALADAAISGGIRLATELGSNYELKDLYLKASQLREKSGNYAGALEFRKKFEVLNDSIIGEKSRSAILTQEIKFETEKKEARIRDLEAQRQIQELSIQQKHHLNYVLAGVVVSTFIISVLLYLNHRQKQRLQRQRIQELETEKKLTVVEAVLRGEEQERARLAKDLHDGLGGMLSGIKYALNAVRGTLSLSAEHQEAFERSLGMLDGSIKEMRRVAHNLMPEALVRFGLHAALRDFCNDINQSGALKVSYLSFGVEGAAFEPTLSITIYRIVQELINNTLKHAQASTAIVQIARTDSQLSLTVEDDGRGFDLNTLQVARGIGWTNIQHRIELVRGRLDVQSGQAGTSVQIEIGTR
jgi:two-component system, NarL family, sensor kinase